MLDTRNEDTICQSLANLLHTRKEAIEVFWAKNMPEYVCRNYWEIDINLFYDYFGLNKDTFTFDEVTVYHVTTRLQKERLGEFKIDNLETVLLSENPLTMLCKRHDIIFKKEEGIAVYYRKKKMVFDAPMEARLRNRLNKLNDSCVNGFLFLENMDDSYIGLTGMPEIFSDIMVALNRRDIQEEYYKQKTCYVAVISAKIEELIFDGIDPSISDQEKTQKIVKFLLCYMGYKKTAASDYMSNPMIRLEDRYCVPAEKILEIREVNDWKDIFEY